MEMVGLFFACFIKGICTLGDEGTTQLEQLLPELKKEWKKAHMVTYIHTTHTTQIPRKVSGKEYASFNMKAF